MAVLRALGVICATRCMPPMADCILDPPLAHCQAQAMPLAGRFTGAAPLHVLLAHAAGTCRAAAGCAPNLRACQLAFRIVYY